MLLVDDGVGASGSGLQHLGLMDDEIKRRREGRTPRIPGKRPRKNLVAQVVMAGAASAGVAGALKIKVQELPVAHVYLNNSASD